MRSVNTLKAQTQCYGPVMSQIKTIAMLQANDCIPTEVAKLREELYKLSHNATQKEYNILRGMR